MPQDLRQRWVKHFWMMEKLNSIRFSRAVNSELRVLTGINAAKEAIVIRYWGCFRMRDGSWSNQLILGRSFLAKNESILNSDLDAICAASLASTAASLASTAARLASTAARLRPMKNL